MIQDNLFNYKKFTYLRWAIFLSLLSGAAYMVDSPRITANGGTWLGYTLGTIGALIIVWLMWLGVRKRQYSNEAGNLRGWVSAHIYLGLSLILVGTLHSGFQLGWNVHSLAYVLMMSVIFSGIWGVGLYINSPVEMSNILNRQSPEQIVSGIEALDKEAAKLSKNISDDTINRALKMSFAQGIFNSRSERRIGRVSTCKTESACELLRSQMANQDDLAPLYQNQVQRLRALKQLRHYYKLRYWMEMWLSIHVPLSFGLLAALTAHIVSVFFYW